MRGFFQRAFGTRLRETVSTTITPRVKVTPTITLKADHHIKPQCEFNKIHAEEQRGKFRSVKHKPRYWGTVPKEENMEILSSNKYKYVNYRPEGEKGPKINISLSSTNGVKKSKYSENELYYINLSYPSGKYKAIGYSRTLAEGLEMYYKAFMQELTEGNKPVEFNPVDKGEEYAWN